MGCLCATSMELGLIPLERPKFRRSCTYSGLSKFLKQNYSLFNSTYQLGHKIIGAGSLGEVKICTHKRSKQTRAVKIIDKKLNSFGKKNLYHVQKEMEIYKELDHPNILKIFEFFDETYYFYIVMEYCEEGSLQRQIDNGHISESQALEIFSQMLSAVAYLHSKGIVHRDLKPENVLVKQKDDKMCVKIIDFDMATYSKGTLKRMIGTPLYMAPEVFKKKYNEKCDIWSLGVILYEMLTGQLPFYDDDDKTLSQSILKGSPMFSGLLWTGKSENSRNLVKTMLEKSPKNRPSAIDIMKDLSDALDKFHVPSLSIHEIVKKKNSSLFIKTLEKFILFQVIDQTEHQEYSAWFKFIDKDKDGIISFQDLYAHFKDYLANPRTVTQLFLDQDDKLEYSEFLYIIYPTLRLLIDENIEVVFNILDKNGLGIVHNSHLEEHFEEPPLAGKEEINLHEFKEIVKQAYNNRHN